MVYLLTMRNVIGVGLLTLCLAQIFILFMVAQFSSSSLASKNDLITLDNNQGATHRKLESGLYRKSTQVLELRSLKEYKDLTDQTNPQIIVHYASWCGHCIHFVPLFEKFAMKVAMATAIARLRDSQVQNITFAAVNCPEQKEICDKNKIDGYPTVCVLHVGSNGGSCQKFVGSTAGVEKLLRKTIFQNGELDGREDMLLSSGNKTKNEVQLAMDRQPRAEDRINDIWITFVHFLLKETPTQLTRVQNRYCLKMLIALTNGLLIVAESNKTCSSLRSHFKDVIWLIDQQLASPGNFYLLQEIVLLMSCTLLDTSQRTFEASSAADRAGYCREEILTP